MVMYYSILASLPEQKKIAEVLSCWDDGIEKLSALIEKKKIQKKGLMQKLLFGKHRLYKTSPLAGEVAGLPAGEGLYAQNTSHRLYSPYIKEFARSMRHNSTDAENKLWQRLRKNQLGYKFRRQHQINNKYIVDFVCLEKKVVVELDGGQHTGCSKDVECTQYLMSENFRIIRFWNNDILTNIEGCLQQLLGILAEKLLTPHPIIFPQGARGKERFSQPWKEVQLAQVLKERKEYMAKDGLLEHISLTKDGIIPKTERYERDFLVKDENKQYKITKLNDICYNPANLKFGVICRNTYGSGIFSPIYVTYEIVGQDNLFIGYLLVTPNLIAKARRFEEGTVYERMAVSSEDFQKVKVFIPSDIAEQKAIADILLKADKEIELLNQKLDALKEQKKGLMQQLLTGKIRVKVS